MLNNHKAPHITTFLTNESLSARPTAKRFSQCCYGGGEKALKGYGLNP